jgi:hypothetical protein
MEIGTGYDLGEIELESGVEDAYLASTVNVTDQPVTGFPPLFQPISENERNVRSLACCGLIDSADPWCDPFSYSSN